MSRRFYNNRRSGEIKPGRTRRILHTDRVMTTLVSMKSAPIHIASPYASIVCSGR